MINKYLEQYKLVITEDSGEEIERRKNIVYTHTGIMLGKHRDSGHSMVFHNHSTSGPSVVTLDEFASGFKWQYTKRVRHDLDKVLMRTFEQLQTSKRYHTVRYNCQHATSYSRLGKFNSLGVLSTASLLSVVLFLSALTTRGGKKP